MYLGVTKHCIDERSPLVGRKTNFHWDIHHIREIVVRFCIKQQFYNGQCVYVYVTSFNALYSNMN
jgi:hypothetical protein